MKILFYNHTGQVSGAERLLLMILAGLNRDSFDPIVVCPAQGPLLKLAAELAVPGQTVAGLDARFTWRPDHLVRYLKSFFEVMSQLRREVTTIKPDLIHANSIRAGLVASVATLGLSTRVVWHLHDLLPRHPLSSAIRCFAFLSTRARMIAISEAVAGNFCGRISLLRNRVTVILNAIELEKFSPHPDTRQKTRAELQIADGAFLIGIVGQLTPRKGQLELLRAFGQAGKELPTAVLMIVGAPLFNRDDVYAQQLKETSAQLGMTKRVRMVGGRNDVPAIMQALDLLVINSTVEPFGLVALEAMACGTPVLAVISGGIPEVIKHDQNGWLVPQGDEQVLAEAIVKLSRQPELRARFAAEGKRSVAAQFSAERYLEELAVFYQRHAFMQTIVIDEQPAPVQPGTEIRLDIQAGGVS